MRPKGNKVQSSNESTSTPRQVPLIDVESANDWDTGEDKLSVTMNDDNARPSSTTRRSRQRRSAKERGAKHPFSPGGTIGLVAQLLPKKDRETDIDYSMTIWQAAREGILEVVKKHIESDPGRINEEAVDTGCGPLLYACKFNRAAVAEYLLDKGANPDLGSKDGSTPLHYIAKHDSRDCARVLLKYGAKTTVQDIRGKTPLHVAARKGNHHILKVLLGAEDADPNSRDADFITPLHDACMAGCETSVETLLENNSNIKAKDINEMTPLMVAAAEGHINIMEKLLETLKDSAERKKKYIIEEDSDGNTALHLCAQNRMMQAAKLLIGHGASVRTKKKNLQTPLHVSAVFGFVDIAQLLVESKAEVNPMDAEHMTPIHRAAMYGRPDIIKLLIGHGGDLNAKTDENSTPLHCACWKGQAETVDFLLEHGAQVAAVDSSLKTALHWAVQSNQFDVMTHILNRTGSCILDYKDKLDQTVLHYAAKSGNTAILKTLIYYGACVAERDNEEKTPLHLASENNNHGCVEALIDTSKSEMNDPDIDGRTPLHLASFCGHRAVVKALVALGADATARDDSRRTPLMLASMSNALTAMEILLDNQSRVNAVDKQRNSPLHFACAANHVDAVKLLLLKHADVTLKNAHAESPLDMTLANLAADAAVAMLESSKWQEVMSVRDDKHFTPMRKLIKRIPEAALVVLDHCMQKSSTDPEDPDLSVSFDFQYVDPGPSDKCSKKKRWVALDTMVQHEQKDLLAHPLSQHLLNMKWMKFGRWFFILNLMTYIMYVVLLLCYTMLIDAPIKSTLVDFVNYCPITLTATELANTTLVKYYLQNGQVTWESRAFQSAGLEALYLLIFITVLIFFIKELVSFFKQKLLYFVEPLNYLVIFQLIATVGFLLPPMFKPCVWQWRFGWIAVFLSWINLIMYLRRVDTFGIYVIMMTAVGRSLLKIFPIFLFFMVAFAGAFYIMMGGKFAVFENAFTNFVTVLVMTTGEIDFFDKFIDTNISPFRIDAIALLVVFIFCMPILIMNLMVGIAVGDIDKIQKNSYFQRMQMQVVMMSDMEATFPRVIQKKLHKLKHEIKPNEGRRSCWQRFKTQVFGSSKSTVFLSQKGRGDPTMDLLNAIHKELLSGRRRINRLEAMASQQTNFLQQMGRKMDLEMRPMTAFSRRDTNEQAVPDDLLSTFDARSVRNFKI